VVELLPDGRLSHMLSQALETGAGIVNVTGIEVTVIGPAAQILLTDARGDRIHHFAIPLADLGGIITAQGGTTTGSALDDRLIGSATADTLQGGTGDDFLLDGGGNDLLFGGTGADVFVFGRDDSPDRIGDFQAGTDKLDVSDWGRIYTAMALQLTATPTGAVVSYGTETLTITRAGGGSLALTDADFLF
jgi:Ca2+-binding RTX toxin-like protein